MIKFFDTKGYELYSENVKSLKLPKLDSVTPKYVYKRSTSG
jgi:hypothetical protein